MDAVIIAAASYLIYAMVAGFALTWLLAEDRRGKVELALAAVIGLVITLIVIKIASASYVDPRPFLPVSEGGDGIVPLLDHAPDNGFPSDHASAAGLMATLVLLRRRIAAGIWFALAAVLVAWGRVAAGVHHLLDVAVGVGIGAVSAAAGIGIMLLLVHRTRLLAWSPLARWLGTAADPPRN